MNGQTSFEIIMTQFDEMVEENGGVIMAIFDLVRYQGFNPLAFRRKILLKLKSDGLQIGDLIASLIIYLTRGTNHNKIVSKTTDEGIRILERVTGSLGLKFTKSSELHPDHVTLSRIAVSFPDVMGMVVSNNIDAIDRLGTNVPHQFCFPSGASLIETTNEDAFNEWCLWAFEFHKKINPSDRTLLSPSDRMVRFWRLSWKSDVLNDADRSKVRDKMSAYIMKNDFKDAKSDISDFRINPHDRFNRVLTTNDEFVKLVNWTNIKDKDLNKAINQIQEAVSLQRTTGKSFTVKLPNDYIHHPIVIDRILEMLGAEYITMLTSSIAFVYPDGSLVKSKVNALCLNKTTGEWSDIQITGDWKGATFYKPVTNDGAYTFDSYRVNPGASISI